MTDSEIQKFGSDIALAIRARGQLLADAVKRAGLDSRGASLLTDAFEQAAQVAELRTQFARMNAARTDQKGAKS